MSGRIADELVVLIVHETTELGETQVTKVDEATRLDVTASENPAVFNRNASLGE
jgi:hypothetical protein